MLYLIKALPDLEAFLYSTSVKKYYRDHTEHALRVAVLGDTYFTTEIKKVTLVDDILLNLDEFSWLLQFKNEKAKELMKFNFNSFSKEKEKTFGRLDRGENFSKTTINLQDVKMGKKTKGKGEILSRSTIII